MSILSITAVNLMEQEGAAIARGLRRRDPEVLDRLIEQYQHRLLRYLVYLTSNREFAEDLFQETWMRVLERGTQYNGKSRFDTWLFAIARHLVIDNSRKKIAYSLEALTEPQDGSVPREFAGKGPSPFESLQYRESGEKIGQALTHLEIAQREVVMLRFQEDMSLDEIAEVTGAPLSTVKSRLYRGLEALRPVIEKQQQAAGASA
ncbi:MAG TPA: sigma-70 family RNA polymerase sigma factor [Terriglobales bacterium]|nr:sigma-70 family RNA polymerase sigma factor [Terriglobales bacterium]